MGLKLERRKKNVPRADEIRGNAIIAFSGACRASSESFTIQPGYFRPSLMTGNSRPNDRDIGFDVSNFSTMSESKFKSLMKRS